MAYDFSKNTSNYMTLPASHLGTLLNGAAAISYHVIVTFDTLSTTAGANNDMLLGFIGTAAGLSLNTQASGANSLFQAGGRSVNTDSFQSLTGSTLTTGVEYSLGAVLNFTGDSITLYKNGASDGTASRTFANNTWTDGAQTSNDWIGASGTTTPTSTDRQTDGRISEVAVWKGDIGLAGFQQLNNRYSASMVRPDILVWYRDLIGSLSSGKGPTSPTITGTVSKADHPRIIMPSAQILQFPAAAAAGGIAPRALNHLHKLMNA